MLKQKGQLPVGGGDTISEAGCTWADGNSRMLFAHLHEGMCGKPGVPNWGASASRRTFGGASGHFWLLHLEWGGAPASGG